MTSYSLDTLAAIILGLELDHYVNSNQEFFKVVQSVMNNVSTEYSGVSAAGKGTLVKQRMVLHSCALSSVCVFV